MITGSLVALVTPMHADGVLDFARLAELIDWHIAEGTDAVVIVGTTGESPTVDFDEHCALIRFAVERSAGRIPVIAGTGANSTSEAIELTEYARDVGANACLSVVPYYNKPTQEGMYRHFRAQAEAVDVPLVLYNVPGRTVADLGNETVLRLAEIPNIVGIKDATADLLRAAELIQRAPPGFALYSGDDGTTLPFLLLGGHGAVSVTANIAPRSMHELCAAAIAGELTRARALNDALLGLHRQLFCEPNPIPVKWALARMGRIDTGIRLPLSPLSEPMRGRVLDALSAAGIALPSDHA
ncbi:MAG: 4-hydroxy-tetrahydrodipicolinate synthase [Rhodocyclaceae bacterium]|nr:4-hydroxy-tetrahydrodipicolinate synthase [Rhodocyclaceae bacterium]MCG3187748.1 4-hydroxy-tetrahydrodipicolinate synthase [Rhodocyclaceae bacterium]